MKTIGLCLITKNEEKNIPRLFASLENIDCIYLTDTGSTDNTIAVARQVAKSLNIPIEISHFEWCDDFAKARNFNFAQAKTDWILWVDADDTIEGADKLREYIEFAEIRKITDIRLKYRYYVENNIDVTTHAKDRIFKNGLYEWHRKDLVHENAFPKVEHLHKAWYPTDESITIRHWATKEELEQSGKRNLALLQKKYDTEVPKDPRTVFYLGRESYLTGDKEKSKKHLEEYLEMVDYGHERINACTLLTDWYMSKGDFKECERLGFEAIRSDSEHPAGYLLVATSYLKRGFYDRAVDYAKKGLEKKVSIMGGEIQSPKGLQQQGAWIMSESFKGLKDYDKAIASLEAIKPLVDAEDLKDIDTDIAKLNLEKMIIKELEAFKLMANTALRSNKLELIKPLIAILPESLLIKKEVLRLKRAVGLAKEWQKGTAVIFCGNTLEEFDQDTNAIGGSETAVIEMAKELGKLGVKVTVYNGNETEKTFGNVTYKPVDEINFADKFNIFISWRNPYIFDQTDVFAKKSLLWLHDVPDVSAYKEETISKIDKILVLSEYHRSLLPSIPDDKSYITSNGIDTEIIKSIKVERNPKHIVYTSSSDRGLETLLDMLPDIKKEIPDVKVSWAYGWDTFDKIRQDSESQKWKSQMQDKMKAYGVTECGRLSKKELYELQASALIWAYPTVFPEINCITALENQANGTYPITSGFAALKETQIFGDKVEDKEEFKKILIERLKNPDEILEECEFRARIALEQFSWSKIAKSWLDDLFGDLGVSSNDNILVSVFCLTIRPAMMRVLKEELENQTYKNIELIIVDGRFDERKDEVKEFFKDASFKVLHLPDPKRNKKEYPYGLCHADNVSLFAANGELVVFLQDFIKIPKDGIEKYVELYKLHPDKIYSGVDDRCGFIADKLDREDKIDCFLGGKYELKKPDYISRRIRIGGAIRRTTEPMEWELNWAAAPKKILEEMGGWNLDFDKGFGYDNTEFALRYVYNGGEILIDETNKASAISHWDLYPNDDLGVPTRNNLTNDKRYAVYMNYLRTAKSPKVKLDYTEPKYDNFTLNRIKQWKEK